MAKIELFRGDARTLPPVKILRSMWTPGGHLFFGAKSTPDDDITDANAILKKTLDDTHIDSVNSDATYVAYTIALLPADTTVAAGFYIGEFQFVDANGNPTTFTQVAVEITADINRRVT